MKNNPNNIETLFRSLDVGPLHLKNRLVMPPMTRQTSPGGIPNEDTANYYRLRAEGGVGLIITEGTTIDRKAASPSENIPNFHEPEALAGWRRVVQEVHKAGGKIAPQIWHQGISRKNGTGPYPEAPSEGPSAIDGQNVEMSDEDIADTIAAFAKAAKTAKEIGFDAVEIHGAHGYLVDQFLWEKTNFRTDSFGGSLEKRAKFAVELVREIRKSIGPSFPLILRFSQYKIDDYVAKLARTPAELEKLLLPISEAGVDIFHASTRRYWEPEFKDSDLNLAGWTKKITGKATITVGSVGLSGADVFGSMGGEATTLGDLSNLLRRMENDEFDLVAVGRALINDYEWVNKVKGQRFSELTPFTKESLSKLSTNVVRDIIRK